MKKLNIGLVGYGFMGRAHSNAFLSVGQFFDLKYQPVLKAVAARDPEKVKRFAHKWGYESHYADWRGLIEDQNGQREVYQMTDEGYRAADRLREQHGKESSSPPNTLAGPSITERAERFFGSHARRRYLSLSGKIPPGLDDLARCATRWCGVAVRPKCGWKRGNGRFAGPLH